MAADDLSGAAAARLGLATLVLVLLICYMTVHAYPRAAGRAAGCAAGGAAADAFFPRFEPMAYRCSGRNLSDRIHANAATALGDPVGGCGCGGGGGGGGCGGGGRRRPRLQDFPVPRIDWPACPAGENPCNCPGGIWLP